MSRKRRRGRKQQSIRTGYILIKQAETRTRVLHSTDSSHHHLTLHSTWQIECTSIHRNKLQKTFSDPLLSKNLWIKLKCEHHTNHPAEPSWSSTPVSFLQFSSVSGGTDQELLCVSGASASYFTFLKVHYLLHPQIIILDLYSRKWTNLILSTSKKA